MNFKFKTAAVAILATSLVASYAYAADTKPVAKKHVATKKKAPKSEAAPVMLHSSMTDRVQTQIQDLRDQLQRQIDGLKTDLATKDAQLKQAQQAAADAQASAAKAQEAANAQQQAVSANEAAVSTLQSTVTDLKGNQVSLATTVSDETSKIKKAIDSPSVLHYKGISITPGGFLAAETVYRTKATGGDIPTAFSAIPYESADAYSLSEFYGSGRQSRVSMMAEGKTTWGAMRGYVEGDFLGTGITSNNNQSNSYVFRQRTVWAEAKTNGGWTFAGGQMWSLAAEGKKGISSLSGDMNTPQTIDPNYVAGFVWTRQYGFRMVKSFNKFAVGISAENPQLLYTASLAGNTPYAVLGSAGNNGGNYNAAISAVGTTTYVQKYANAATTTGGITVNTPYPVYATLPYNTNITNISFNQAPDLIVKVAADPGWGHYEFLGMIGFAHETVYPNVTTDRLKYGGQTDIINGANIGGLYPAASTNGWVPDSLITSGVGASMRLPLIKDKLSFGSKFLFGPGVGRYGNSTLADVTSNNWGGLTTIDNLSGLITVEATPNPRLSIYLNYGGDYAGREDYSLHGAITLSDPTAAEATPGGKWGSTWAIPTTQKAVGYGSYFTDNSGCNAITKPGINSGSSTGYLPGTACGAQTRDVQELTGGYWYDIYKGEHGRLRQGLQYGYAVREGWSGLNGIGAKGIDNMFWTTFRYYLP